MDQQFRIRNENRDCDLATRARRASSFITRGIGLMGRRSLSRGEALILPGCKSITMFFMRFPLDIVFLDENGVVCADLREFRPWRVSRLVPRSKLAIELPSGTLDASGTQVGDLILIEPTAA